MAVTLPHGDPLASELTGMLHGGDLKGLARLLTARPELAGIRMIGRHGAGGGWRTPLHALTDWPGYFPAAPAAVTLLVGAGADPNDDSGGDHPETPLHWAASTDDRDVAVALIDAGARLTTPGGSIGTPLDNAIGYGCWNVARLLVERGAPVDALWHAAALGMLDQLEHQMTTDPSPEVISQAFWHACAGAQRRTAEYLLARGADLNWYPTTRMARPWMLPAPPEPAATTSCPGCVHRVLSPQKPPRGTSMRNGRRTPTSAGPRRPAR
jgi:hypothetical protein